jgi:pimeloyl-ACP methyl ester carboxylesterase
MQIRTRGVEIAFDVVGEGPTVVLGHSFLCSGAMWAPQLGPLSAENRVINIDARGHGASGRVAAPFTLYDLVEDVVAVLDHLGVERAVWAGLSIGGMVALRAALRAPARVSGLILADTDAGAETPWNRLKHASLAWLVRGLGVRPVLPRLARLMFGATTRRARPDLVRQWVDRFASVDVPSALLTLAALDRRDDLLPELPSIRPPALVLVGAEDRALRPERSRRLAQALPQARFVEVPRAGHLSSLEQPAEVTTAMIEFLRSPAVRTAGLPPP